MGALNDCLFNDDRSRHLIRYCRLYKFMWSM